MKTFDKLIKVTCFICISISLATMFSSCEKLVETDSPITTLNSDVVYSNDAAATAVLTNLYSSLSDKTYLSIFTGLSSDEIALYSAVTEPGLVAYYQNTLTPTNDASNYWTPTYNNIFVANSAIEGLTASKTLTTKVKEQLLGEAKFMRAFFYFYLVNLYGDVPLNLTTDYKSNSVRPRTEKSQVYSQIITDLKDAQQLLGMDYIDAAINPTIERTRPNKNVATALLARVYLYNKEFSKSEEQATALIENINYFKLATLDGAFLKGSKEIIWAFQSTSSVITNTQEAYVLKLTTAGPDAGFRRYIINPALKKSFETSDQRKMKWLDSVLVNGTTYFFPVKYKVATFRAPVTEQSVIFRLGEQYLIRAEARAFLDNLEGAKSDLNSIRGRAGLGFTNAATKAEIINAIMHERQVELFTEWGHRWLDLKRNNMADNVLKSIKANWQTYDQLYPIPLAEITGNPGIRGQQNVGY